MTPDEIRAELERIDKFIAGKPYSVLGVNARGHLFVTLAIPDWEGKREYELFRIFLGRLWHAMKSRMLGTFVRGDKPQEDPCASR